MTEKRKYLGACHVSVFRARKFSRLLVGSEMYPCFRKFIVFLRKMVHFNGPQLLTPYHGHALVRVLSTDKEMIAGKDAIGAHAQDDALLLPILKTFAKCTRSRAA